MDLTITKVKNGFLITQSTGHSHMSKYSDMLVARNPKELAALVLEMAEDKPQKENKKRKLEITKEELENKAMTVFNRGWGSSVLFSQDLKKELGFT